MFGLLNVCDVFCYIVVSLLPVCFLCPLPVRVRPQSASADELMALVKFGAEEAFRSTQAAFTDEDIDIILAKGEERTEQMNAQLRSSGTQHSLANFSLADDAGGEAKSIYDFHGVQKTGARPLFFIEPPKRERKTTVYDADAYYRSVASQNSAVRSGFL